MARLQRLLLWGGLLEPETPRRTVRDTVVDAAMIAGTLSAGAFVLASTWSSHSAAARGIDIALGVLAAGALWWRRTRPLEVALLATVLSAASALAAMVPLAAVFNGAIRLRARPVVAVCVLAIAATATLAALYPRVSGRDYGWQLAIGTLLTAVALGWGLFVRAQRDLLRGLRSRSEDQARTVERQRIAREMHDVLAHRLSILSVHAGALANAGPSLPPEYAKAAGVVGASASRALDELREVIGLLRGEEATAPPQPTLPAIVDLVAESRAAGMRIDYHEELLPGVPDAVGRTAYRTVQEGLTNARKHSVGGPVELHLRTGPPLVVELVTHGSGDVPRLPGSGTGLVGLAERVTLAGGEFSSGPDDRGNFVLRASVPW